MDNAMRCSEIHQLLEQEPDGALPAAAASHVADCSDCSVLWHDLGSIRNAVSTLECEEAQPPERVWISLRAQLAAEGLIRATGSEASGWTRADAPSSGWMA